MLMTSLAASHQTSQRISSQLPHWLPALALPTAVLLWGGSLPPWVVAWLLTFVIYVGFKWLAFAGAPAARTATLRASLQFLFLWPGMDAEAFLSRRVAENPTTREVVFATANLLGGLALVFVGVRLATPWSPWLAGWIGLVGLAMFLLFGLAHLLSVVWRLLGVAALPIMNRPHRAASLAEFWGARWNLAFHDIGRLFVFHPLRRRIGAALAVVAVFLFSGVVHDLVMSVPARGGSGWPTLYFLLQAAGVLLERSEFGKEFGLSRGWRGRLFAATLVLLPLAWLFHEAFVGEIILPTLRWIGAC